MIDGRPLPNLEFDVLRPIGRREQGGVRRALFTFRDEERLDGRRVFWQAYIARAGELREGPTYFIDADPPPSSELPDPED